MFRVCINTIIQITIKNRTSKAIQKFCLNQKSFAAIGGKRRRNVHSFQEIQWCLRFHTCNILFKILLLVMVDIQLINSSRTLMILWSCGVVVFLFFKGVFLPWNILLKETTYQYVWNNSFKNNYTPFYVRKPELIPRT